MKISDSLKGIVATSVITGVLEGDSDVQLDVISSNDTDARAKYGTNTFPTIDPALVSVQNGNLFSKTGSDDFTFPLEQSTQIARSIAVLKGNLPVELEYDTTIDWSDSRVESNVSINDLIEIGTFHFFIDIELNDSETLRTTTYTRDISVPRGYYGNLSDSITDNYLANGLIIDIGPENETSEQRIDDGSVSGGLYLSDTVSGLVEAAQQRRLVNANVLLRLCSVRDGRILFGPIRINKLKIDKAIHSVSLEAQSGVIQLQLIKSWDTILNTYGLRAQHADHSAKVPGDNFFRYTEQVNQTFTWKEA